MSISVGNFITLYMQDGATWIPFVGEVSSNFSISKDAIEITTKASVDELGNYVKEYDGRGEYTFNFSVEGIQTPNSELEDVLALVQNGTKVKFRFGRNAATGKVYEGDGFVMSFEVDASKNEAVTFSAEIQGTGGIKLVTVGA